MSRQQQRSQNADHGGYGIKTRREGDAAAAGKYTYIALYFGGASFTCCIVVSSPPCHPSKLQQKPQVMHKHGMDGINFLMTTPHPSASAAVDY